MTESFLKCKSVFSIDISGDSYETQYPCNVGADSNEKDKESESSKYFESNEWVDETASSQLKHKICTT